MNFQDNMSSRFLKTRVLGAAIMVCALLVTLILTSFAPNSAVAATGQAPALTNDWQNVTAGGDASNVDVKTVNLSATGNADTAVSGKLDVVAMIDTGFNMGNGSVDAATNAIKALASQVLSINSIVGDTNTATAPVNLDVGFFSTAQPAALAGAHTGFKAKASDLTGLSSDQIQTLIKSSRDGGVTMSQTSSYWDTAFRFANSLTTRSGAKKVFMFITSGYPATSASRYGTDYVNPIVLGGTTMPLASSPIATMVKNNWNIYNVSLDQAVYPCWDVDGQTTGSGQCYINVNTTWSATVTSNGRNKQFYDKSLYTSSTSRPSGSTLSVGSSSFNQWLTPFESLEYYERAANPSNTNVIQNLKATTATATQSFLDIADTLMNQFFMKPATFSQKFNSTYVAPVNVAALPTAREARLQQGDTDMSSTYGVSFNAVGMSAEQLAAVKRLTKVYYSANTLQVTVPFIPDGTKYTVSYKVKPTQAAYDAVMAKNDSTYRGPDVGDANTGTLSAGQKGFFIDAAKGDTKVTYVSYSGENTDPYSLKKYEPLNSVLGIAGVPVIPSTSVNPELMTRAVVTVTMQSIPVTKQWSPVAPTGASAVASLYVDGSTTAVQTVTLNAANNYTSSFTNLAPNHTYTVKETGLDSTLYSSTVYRADLGGLKAWGDNTSGKLGTGSAATSPVGVTFKDASGNKLSPQPVIQSVSASAGHTLALDSNGAIWAWGSNSNGQLGDGTTVDKSTPVKLNTGTTTFKQVSAGAAFSVALDSSGNVWTWGSDSNGQLGNGSTTGNVLKPTSIGFSAVKVSAGDAHVLALKSLGSAAWSWGSNSNGQLGQYDTNWLQIKSKKGDQTSPGQLSKSGSVFNDIAAGGIHSVGLGTDGKMYTWGDNSNNQLARTPDTLTSLGFNSANFMDAKIDGSQSFSSVYAAGNVSAGLTASGSIYTVGNNSSGQLGHADGGKSIAAIGAPSGTTFSTMAIGTSHMVARDSSGNVWTWGSNSAGQLGNGTNTSSQTPTKLSAQEKYSVIGAGGNSSFAYANEVSSTSITLSQPSSTTTQSAGWNIVNTIIATAVKVKYVVENGSIASPDSGTTNTRTVTYNTAYHTLDQATDIDNIAASMTPNAGYGDGEWTTDTKPTAGDNVAGSITYTYTYKVTVPPVSELPLTGDTGLTWQVWALIIFAAAAGLGTAAYLATKRGGKSDGATSAF